LAFNVFRDIIKFAWEQAKEKRRCLSGVDSTNKARKAMFTTLEDMILSIRAYNMLKRGKVNNSDDLLAMDYTAC
jgi:DNA-directed RNA polymerase alpha subunit